MKATLLGTASAWPIPRPGCTCAQCAEARSEPALRRTRSGLRIEAGGEVVLVDAGPDVAVQLDRVGGPPQVDRVLITHSHEDHVLGLGDLVHLRVPTEAPLIVHAAPLHRERIAQLFPQFLRPGQERITWAAWEDGTQVTIGELTLEGFETGHRDRFETTAVLLHVPGPGGPRRIAYATDMGTVPTSSCERLRGIDAFVGDGTYLGPAGRGHPGTDAVLALAQELGIGRVAFTHIGHVELGDADLRARLGVGVEVLRDGDDLLGVVAG